MTGLYRLEVTLQVQGPILTKASTSGAYGIDAVAARNSAGEFYLPGTLLKGRISEALVDCAIPVPADWLGATGDSRARLVFRDLVHMGPDVSTGVLHRIAIDQDAETARRGALIVIESPFAPGESYTFRGDIEFLGSIDDARAVRQELQKALDFLPSIAGLHNVGFGVIIGREITDPSLVDNVFTTNGAPLEQELNLTLKPLFPFCFAQARPDGNLFVSTDEIPGGAIKGALAETLRMVTGKSIGELANASSGSPWHELAAHFDAIGVSHAFPALPHAPRPERLPHSLARVHATTLDAVTERGAFVARPRDGGDGKPGEWRAPAFLWDWKSEEEEGARGDFYTGRSLWPDTKREVRVRTAISEETRSALKEGLFAYETVVPEGFLWKARINLPETSDPRLAAELEGALQLAGLWGFGKTKSRATVYLSARTANESLTAARKGPLPLFVTLQTDALLFDIRGLDESDTKADTLGFKYRAYFQSLHKDLSLVRYFASQRLARRHSDKAMPDYHPWMLTDAGSVFVLAVNSDGAARELEQCERLGLPALGPTQPGWKSCPYLRENGYGEILIRTRPSIEEPTGLELHGAAATSNQGGRR